MSDPELLTAEGVAALLAADGIASYNGTPANLPPIHLQGMRPKDGLVVGVSVYGVGDDPLSPMSTLGIQVAVRDTGERPQAAAALMAKVFDLLHGWQGTLPTGIRVSTCHRQSTSLLARDSEGDWHKSDNYYLTIHRPGRNRR